MVWKTIKLIVLVTLSTTLCFPLFSEAATSRLINFQGRLTDQQGNPLEGTYTIKFSLYPSPDPNASPLWTEEHDNVSASKGIVNVLLGSIQSFDEPVKITFDQERYLGITIDCDHDPNTKEPELTPRQRILPAIYAYTAGTAYNADIASNADKLDGKDSSEFTTPEKDAGRPGVVQSIYEGNIRLTDKYLGKEAMAVDADKVDGYHATTSSSATDAIPVINSGIIYNNLRVGYASSASSAGSVSWGNISGVPSSFNPSSHKHTGTVDCYWADWGLCLDNAGQCTCNYTNGYVMVGVERSNDKYLYNWERTLCCRVK